METKDFEAMGREAYKSGKHSAPCLNNEFMKHISGPVGSNIEIMKAYIKGWQSECAKALMEAV